MRSTLRIGSSIVTFSRWASAGSASAISFASSTDVRSTCCFTVRCSTGGVEPSAPKTCAVSRMRAKSRPRAFQWSTAGRTSSRSARPTISSQRPEAELRHDLAHFLGDEVEEVDDVFGLTGELLAQLGVLGGDAHRARVEVADAHHHAAHDDEGRGGEPELLGAEQRADDDVAAGLHLAVDLHRHAIAQMVERRASAGSRPGRAPTARPRA